METISINVFQFSELDAQAKKRASADYEARYYYPWTDEALASLKALAEWAGGELRDYSIAWDYSAPSHADFWFDMDAVWDIDDIRRRAETELGGIAEDGRGLGDCRLTGFCFDEDAIDGFRRALRAGVSDFKGLMREAFYTWLRACQADYVDSLNEESLSDTFDANEVWFLKSGDVAPGRPKKTRGGADA